MTITNFTFDDLVKDVNQDKIFLFILSYEYALNYNQVLTMYNFSPDIFWSFINILKPILKLGDRKAAQIKQSATKVYFKLLGSDVELSEIESEYVTYLSQYINDSFTNGEHCLHITQVQSFPIVAKGSFLNASTGREIREIILNSYSELKKYIDCIEKIEIGGEVFNKTSRLNYMLEKYYPDLTVKELRIKNVREIINMLDASAIAAHNDRIEELRLKRIENREQLVGGRD